MKHCTSREQHVIYNWILHNDFNLLDTINPDRVRTVPGCHHKASGVEHVESDVKPDQARLRLYYNLLIVCNQWRSNVRHPFTKQSYLISYEVRVSPS